MSDRSEDPMVARLVQSFGLLVSVQRQGSFAGAARALDLDPSAVSHRIRALEAELRLPLFERSTRSITPTRAGAILCEAATRSWADAGRALAAARDLQSARAIRLSVHSSLAMKWLLPRLPAAAAAGLDLSIDVREELAVFDKGPGVYRRNVIVEGQDLNEWIGREFEIQGVRFLGTEEAKPCFWMDEAFAPGALKALVGKGGLRARILEGGTLRSGVPVG